MPALLAPLGLIALVALVVPVLIHLIRRSERKEVDFAALRWLRELNRPRKQLRLHDRWLLLTRLLLVATLALLLAQLVRFPSGVSGQTWVGISPAVDAVAARSVIDTGDADVHWLAPGFPSIETPAPDKAVPTASLIREIDSRLPVATRMVLVVPEVLTGLDAERLRLRHTVSWKALPAAASPMVQSTATASLRVAVRKVSADAESDQQKVAQAIVAAWQAAGRRVDLDIGDQPVSALQPDLLILLGGMPDAATQRWVEQGGRALMTGVADDAAPVIMDREDGTPLLRVNSAGRGQRYSMASPLLPQAVPELLDPAFPARLLKAIEPPPQAPDSALASAVAPQRSAPALPGPAQSLANWVALLSAVLFLIERLLATRRRGAVPA